MDSKITKDEFQRAVMDLVASLHGVTRAPGPGQRGHVQARLRWISEALRSAGGGHPAIATIHNWYYGMTSPVGYDLINYYQQIKELTRQAAS